MKLIIEKDARGALYIYRETEKRFKQNEKTRAATSTKVDVKVLDDECDSNYLDLSSHIVVNIK